MKKILIVDYDQSSLASLQGIFAGQGYQVVTAADGQTGWDKYNKESPDLVLMEAMLPKVHGFELCQRITSERNSQATVFIMTGVYKDRVYRTEALRTYGASEYFEKPLKMAELIASVEAVLGRPESKPAEAAEAPAQAAAAREIRVESVPAAEPRKREKARSDDSLFALPDDLDRLSREIPKVRRPSPARIEPTAEPRLDAIADELLKSVIVESKTPKPLQSKPTGGNGNGNGNGNGGSKAEIEQFLATALADFDLNKEKVKVPKPVAVPAPVPVVREAPVAKPAPAATLEPKPTPPTPQPAPERKPTPPTPPEPAFSAPAKADMKNTLTPGDPGSDVSPFFVPDKTRPEAPVEKPKARPAAVAPVPPPPAPKPAKPVEKAAKTAPAPAAAPARHEPAKPEPVKHEAKNVEAEALPQNIFEDFHETKAKPAFPKFVAIGIGVLALAAVGFVLLRPKKAAPVAAPQEQAQVQTPSNTPSEPVADKPAPEVKPAPVKQKAQPQPKPKPANPEPAAAEAILPTDTGSAALPSFGTQSASGPGNGQAANAPQTKTEETAPPAAKTEETTPQQAPTESGTSSDAGTAAAVAAAAAAPPVNEGDLIELSAVTEPPKLVKSAEPVYPMTAQRLGIGGSITVNALIDEKGNVVDTGILKGIQDDKGLGRAAETAVKKWKFQPARKNGVAVKVWKSFVIAFKADANPARRMN